MLKKEFFFQKDTWRTSISNEFITFYNASILQCVVPENIHTPPTEGIGISRGVGGSKAQENPEVGGGCINLYYFFQTGSIIPIC